MTDPKKGLYWDEMTKKDLQKDENQELAPIGNGAKSVIIKVAVSNIPDGEKPSIYSRLTKYRKKKGVSDQDIIRFALAMFLDKIDGVNS